MTMNHYIIYKGKEFRGIVLIQTVPPIGWTELNSFVNEPENFEWWEVCLGCGNSLEHETGQTKLSASSLHWNIEFDTQYRTNINLRWWFNELVFDSAFREEGAALLEPRHCVAKQQIIKYLLYSYLLMCLPLTVCPLNNFYPRITSFIIINCFMAVWHCCCLQIEKDLLSRI